ncbi:hypothetical protein GFB56_05780 [Ensifer sp. T173]|uniref:Uncharacterized protein n=1 Tax=Ensifer canadensis TaxID=555315 RepID=A0AAW4FKU4_9HYPH|nr:hypothetical protein [Ensifer canadensis]
MSSTARSAQFGSTRLQVRSSAVPSHWLASMRCRSLHELLNVSLNRIRFKDKTWSNSKCYSGLCASNKTRRVVGP